MQNTDAIVATHQVLRKLLTDVLEGRDVLKQGTRLVALLPAHFALEEQAGGYFDSLTRGGGAAADAADRFRHEHRHLLALAGKFASVEPEQQVATLIKLAKAVRAHEVEESRWALSGREGE